MRLTQAAAMLGGANVLRRMVLRLGKASSQAAKAQGGWPPSSAAAVHCTSHRSV